MVEIVHGDITKIPADVIINAANTENVHGGGVDLAIAHAAGNEYKYACDESNGQPIGEFLVSPAGKLDAKKIIDIPTINLITGQVITYKELETVWNKVLDYCIKKGYKTVATPLLGTGVVGLDGAKVQQILSDVAKDKSEVEVKIVIYAPS